MDWRPNPVLSRIKTNVIIPTYNESGTIGPLISAIRTHLPSADVLIIDDASTDGTGALVSGLAAADPQISLVERAGKLGLGTAYILGFRRALSKGYELVITMDADFSHDPKSLPQLVEATANCDVAIGSRYIPGGSTPDWRLSRRLISRFGNWLARTTLHLQVRDCTSGYKCYRREALASLDLNSIKVIGYGFQIETVRETSAAGMRVCEIPITFIDRRVGKSKMSGTILAEATGYILRHAFTPHRDSK
ncbi:MAG TPA: polyprenol monophosphomannose synthase [Chthoniobacterales bacterium]|jgi:dolichol-phosphate mannosyltransferase